MPAVAPDPATPPSWIPLRALPGGRRPAFAAPSERDLRRRLAASYLRRLRQDARRKARALLPP